MRIPNSELDKRGCMKAEFWHNRWEKREIGFHLSEVNPYLIKNFDVLKVSSGDRVFVPLCGKTNDIGWLLEQGFKVIGAELSEQAIQELFQNLGIAPTVSSHEKVKLYSSEGVDIWVGDIFDLTSKMIGKVDAIYDRAALVALPEEMRTRYAEHLVRMTHNAPQLLLTFEYEQSQMDGPPFAVTESMISTLYGNSYNIQKVEQEELQGGLKGYVAATNSVWCLV